MKLVELHRIRMAAQGKQNCYNVIAAQRFMQECPVRGPWYAV